MAEQQENPRCHLCRHYYVTWDPAMPYGCRTWGFKAARLPSQEVLSASGKLCMLFEPKPRR